MQVMLGHFNVGMSHDTLNCFHVYTHSLELGNIGVAATMGRQYPHAIHFRERGPEPVPETTGVDRLARNKAVLHEMSGPFPEKHGARADIGWHGHVPDAGGRLGLSDARPVLYHVDRLSDMNAGAVRLYVLRLQRKNLLCPHTRCRHKADRMAHFIMGQFRHKPLDLLLGKCLPPLHRTFGFHLLRKTDGIFSDKVISLSFLHDLVEHGAAFGNG